MKEFLRKLNPFYQKRLVDHCKTVIKEANETVECLQKRLSEGKKVKKFDLNQVIYSAQQERLGRYTVAEYVTTETVDGIAFEYVLLDPHNRKVGYSENDIEKNFFVTLDEAREMALQDWKITSKIVTEQLENFTDKTFDELIAKIKAQKEAQKAKGK